ncbi:hypothetical protein FIBSPDRAFT_862447 [Athelia psychrophila]|uniref:Uncharacterized protein n=1 Tax=Athelia psychrophila TaxID=1759441 RepID=A0A166IF58_9AGAM|nr:hypothetical protein FIBSPDRAFT_862447 [Fibularhizoctonia sp. CBS 109695]
MSSSLFTTLGNYLKPYPNEAFLRLRSSSLALVAAFLFTNLLPVPTPLGAWIAVTSSDETGLIWWGLSCIELAIFGLLSLNITQSLWALRYPRKSLPPSTPSKPRSPALAPPSGASASQTKRRLGGLSPSTTPQTQRPFSLSASSSYAASPVSSPSRTLNYSVPSSLGASRDSNTSFGASTSTGMGSPLAAYRGKHMSPVGRALDGSFLSRLANSQDDSDED